MKLSASDNNGSVGKAIDGNPESRYTSERFMIPGMWLQIELDQESPVTGITLNTAASANDYPRGYEVAVSKDGKEWSQPIAKGRGNSAATEITFDPVSTKFIRITQTGKADGNFWSIHELQVFQQAKK